MIVWQAILQDGRIVSGLAHNSSDFMDALQDMGVSRHEIMKVEKSGKSHKKHGRARAWARMRDLYPEQIPQCRTWGKHLDLYRVD